VSDGPGDAAPSEVTDLERRVLAHERVLQSLIAYMAQTEPHFVDHLLSSFLDTMSMARREHHGRDADDYAEEFIRAVMLLQEQRAPHPGAMRHPAPGHAGSRSPEPEPKRSASPVEVQERNGVWRVSIGGVFHGDYRMKADALAAAALLRLARPSAGLMSAIAAASAGRACAETAQPVAGVDEDGPRLKVVRSSGDSD
jgi:hypothetical protein